MDEPRRRRKLLVASVGVATVSYALLSAACGKENTPVTGNLPAPPPVDAEPPPPPVTGNLPAPPPLEDLPVAAADAGAGDAGAVAGDAGAASQDGGAVGAGAGKDAGAHPRPLRPPPTSGNLVAPPRREPGQ